MAQSIDEKIVFAVAPETDGAPTMMVGIPRAAWRNIRDGKCSTFDLTKIGLPIKLVIFGAESHDAAMRLLNEGMKASNTAYVDMRREDFSIQHGQASQDKRGPSS